MNSALYFFISSAATFCSSSSRRCIHLFLYCAMCACLDTSSLSLPVRASFFDCIMDVNASTINVCFFCFSLKKSMWVDRRAKAAEIYVRPCRIMIFLVHHQIFLLDRWLIFLITCVMQMCHQAYMRGIILCELHNAYSAY
jgi:hypothetical protein